MVFLSVKLFSQTTFSWVNYTTNTTYTPWTTQQYMYTMTGSGYTDNALATVTSSAGTGIFKNSSPKYSSSSDPGAAGCSSAPAGLLVSVDWTNASSNVTVVINFDGGVNGVCGPVTFSLYDINDDGFGSWQDAVAISAVDISGTALNISQTADCNSGASPALAASGNGTSLLTFRSGQSTSCTCWGNNSVTIGTSTTVIKSLTIKYYSITSPSTNNNPAQYVSISNISTGGFGCAAITLPVTLTSFNGKCTGVKKRLKWTTASETDNSHFTVEHSLNGVDFSEVGKVNAFKNSALPSDYELSFDEESAEYVYYRLKQTDFNGKENLLKTIYLSCIDKFAELVLSPNPAYDELKLQFASSEECWYTIVIKDLVGRTVSSARVFSTPGNNQFPIEIGSLPPGAYTVVVGDAEGNYRPKTLKFIKKAD